VATTHLPYSNYVLGHEEHLDVDEQFKREFRKEHGGVMSIGVKIDEVAVARSQLSLRSWDQSSRVDESRLNTILC
jgi:hypothetical protein